MQEREACALLKSRFEAAGFHIDENVRFDELGVRFEIDGFDHDRRVGYEYVTEEAGDGWDVDAEVIAVLAGGMKRGEIFVLIVDEHEARDRAALDTRIDTFLGELRTRDVISDARPAAKSKAAKPKPDKATKAAAKSVAKPAKAEPAAAPKRRKKPA